MGRPLIPRTASVFVSARRHFAETGPGLSSVGATALFSGEVEISLNYAGISLENESELSLFHYENDLWIDITTSLDMENDIIYFLNT